MKLAVTSFLAIILAGLAFTRCNNLGGRLDLSHFSNLPSWDSGSTAIANDKFFYIRVKRNDNTGNSLPFALYELEGGYGTDCKIPIDQESSEDVFCMLDKMEGDLWAHPTIIEYNAPPRMCEYIAFSTHWHWNQNAGTGPSTVYKCTEEGSEDTESKECYCLDECTATTHSCSRPDCSEKAEGLCAYNEEAKADENDDNSLANCCIGTYNVTGGENNQKWGGNLQNCIGGLGRISWDAHNKIGIPITKVVSAEKDGFVSDYEIPSIDSFYDGIDSGVIKSSARDRIGVSGTSFVTANYHEDIEDAGSAQPSFYNTSSLHGGSTLSEGYPYITWACLDGAHEVRHQIHLILREWNSREEFADFIESEGSSGDPDVTGTEGGNCDYYEQVSGAGFSECDDAIDADAWKDVRDPDENWPHIIYK